MMDTPKYFNKALPPEPRYICGKCLKKRGDLEIHTISSFVNVACYLCGKIGIHTRLTNASAERMIDNK